MLPKSVREFDGMMKMEGEVFERAKEVKGAKPSKTSRQGDVSDRAVAP